VPPTDAVKLGTKAVHKGAAWDDRALSDSWCTIEPRSACLQKAVPMDGSTLSGEVVGDGYLNPVAPVCLDEWSRAMKASVVSSNELPPTYN